MRGEARALGAPDGLQQRRGRRLPGRPAQPAGCRELAAPARRRGGDAVPHRPPDNAVVFDFKPGLDAGAESLSRRGEDQRFDEERPAARRRRRSTSHGDRGEGETRADVARRDGPPRRTAHVGPTRSRDRRSRLGRIRSWESDPGSPDPGRTTGHEPSRAEVTGPSGSSSRSGRPPDHRRRRHDRLGCATWSTSWPAGPVAPRWCWSRRAPSPPGLAPLGLKRRPGAGRPAGGGVGRAGPARASLHRGAARHG